MNAKSWLFIGSIALAGGTFLAACATDGSGLSMVGGSAKPSLMLPSEQVSAAAAAKGYAGPQACAGCHSEQYNHYRMSGHPKKLRPAAEARAFGAPLPEGYTWDDISYVIGGAEWKIRFVNQQGYIITQTGAKKDRPGKNQYNMATGRWVDYSAKDINKPYNCGTCHTSGYSKEGNQDGRPGLVGTWAFPGIVCEECHGPGAAHAKSPAKANIKVDRTPAACGKCHIRGDADKIPASNGFIQHHEQYNEYLKGAHVGKLGCNDCHNPHKPSHTSIKATCSSCHQATAKQYEGSRMQKSGVDCIECHMPKAGRTAEVFGKYQADIRTHIMRISTAPTDKMFTDDGKFATGKLTLDFACLSCHGSRDINWARNNVKNIHTLGK